EVDTGTWTLNGAVVANPAAVLIVPGDELVFTGTWTVSATGDNLLADVDFSGLSASANDLVSELDITTAYTVGGVALTDDELTDAHDGQTLAATVEVDFDFDLATNDSQGGVLDLSDGAITVTQVD